MVGDGADHVVVVLAVRAEQYDVGLRLGQLRQIALRVVEVEDDVDVLVPLQCGTLHLVQQCLMVEDGHANAIAR